MNKLAQTILNFTNEHKPEISIGIGITGMITSTILAVKATPTAIEKIEKRKEELECDKLSTVDTVKETWKDYAPAVGVGVASIACILYGTSVNLKRNTALATVYSVAEDTLKEYQKKTIELVGEEKYNEIREEVSKSRAKKNPVAIKDEFPDDARIITTGEGDTLIYDSFSGRYFRSSRNAIDRAVNTVNKNLLNEMSVSVNDLYNEMNVPTIYAGSVIGWVSDYELIEVTYDSDVDSNGVPYLILDYYSRPRPLTKNHIRY